MRPPRVRLSGCHPPGEGTGRHSSAAQRAGGISSTRRTIPKSGHWHYYGATRESTVPHQRRTTWIATDDWSVPGSFGWWLPFRFVLLVQFPDGLLQFANIVERQFPGFRQLCHHRLRAPPEKTQDLVQKS